MPRGDKMTNVFQRLLVREFGEKAYRGMVSTILTENEDAIINMDLTCGICADLYRREPEELTAREERLEEALMHSYRISRTFFPFAGCCALLIVLLFLLVNEGYVLAIAVLGIALCAGWKLWEYLMNRYCYVDAKIILCYRIALVEARRAERRT